MARPPWGEGPVIDVAGKGFRPPRMPRLPVATVRIVRSRLTPPPDPPSPRPPTLPPLAPDGRAVDPASPPPAGPAVQHFDGDFTAAAQRNADLVENNMGQYREAKYVYDRQVDVHSHWMGLGLLLIVLGLAASGMALSGRTRMLLASCAR